MNTAPSIDDILEGLIIAIADDIIPDLTSLKAHATAQMMQAMLQGLRQVLPVYETYLVDEHNDMTRVLRDVAATIADTSGPAADRIRERATTMGTWADRPAPADCDELTAAHRSLGDALATTMVDLDELQRDGCTAADDALGIVRGHLGPRYLRDTLTFAVGGGMVGRG